MIIIIMISIIRPHSSKPCSRARPSRLTAASILPRSETRGDAGAMPRTLSTHQFIMRRRAETRYQGGEGGAAMAARGRTPLPNHHPRGGWQEAGPRT